MKKENQTDEGQRCLDFSRNGNLIQKKLSTNLSKQFYSVISLHYMHVYYSYYKTCQQNLVHYQTLLMHASECKSTETKTIANGMKERIEKSI